MSVASPPRRGYLLVETMVAGGIIAVVLGISVTFVVEGRKSVSTAAARQAAMSLARGKCDEIAAALPTSTGDQATLTAVGASWPGFLWQWSTVDAASGIGAASTPAITVSSCEIVCTVEYPTPTGSVDDRATTGAGDGRASVTVNRLWFLPQGGT